MKIIQQDFEVSSKFYCILFLICAIGFMYGFYSERNSNTFVSSLMFIFVILMFIYGAYGSSLIYKFKQKEIIVAPLFGLLGEKTYPLKDLTQVEYSINPRDVFDSINIYFGSGKNKKKISISMFQASLGDVKLFLHTHVENLEEIADVQYRKFMW